MKNQNKILLSVNKSQTVFGISIPLDIEEKEILDNVEKINFSYIKYDGVKDFQEDGLIIKKHFIEFVNMPIELIKELVNIIQNRINELSYKETIFEAISFIVNLFSKHMFKDKEQKKFNGDLGEALFILAIKRKFNIDFSKYYRSENNLYDFYIPEIDKNIEIKSSQKNKGEIIINKRQIDESENKYFYVSEYQFVEGQSTILDIYEEIGLNSKVIKDKYDYWKFISSQQEGATIILKNKTIDLDKINCFKIENDCIPKIFIENDKCVNSIDVTLNISIFRDENLKSIKEIINYL